MAVEPTRNEDGLPPYLERGDGCTMLRVKATPGASRSEIKGPIGDHLRIRVAAPPEGGRANRAIITLLAESLRCSISDIELVSGGSSPRKRFRLAGVDAEDVATALAT